MQTTGQTKYKGSFAKAMEMKLLHMNGTTITPFFEPEVLKLSATIPTSSRLICCVPPESSVRFIDLRKQAFGTPVAFCIREAARRGWRFAESSKEVDCDESDRYSHYSHCRCRLADLVGICTLATQMNTAPSSRSRKSSGTGQLSKTRRHHKRSPFPRSMS